MARTRTFLGIEIPAALRTRLGALQAQLAKSGAEVKWVDPANLHLTLLFLGELDDRDLASACKLAGKAMAKFASFRVSLRELGAFPTLRRPKILWAGVRDEAGELQAVFAKLQESLATAGLYRTEDRLFVPHLTLGRASDDAAEELLAAELPQYAAWEGGAWEARAIAIFSSELRRSGPVYNVIGRATLSADD